MLFTLIALIFTPEMLGQDKTTQIDWLQKTQPKTVVIHSMGTLGDIFPFLEIAKGLKKQNHRVIFATQKEHQNHIQAAQIEFAAVRPDFSTRDPEVAAKLFNLKSTASYIFETLLLPHLKDTYEDLLNVCTSANLLISGSFALTARLVSLKLGLAWISATLQPLGYLSMEDVPITPSMSWWSYIKHFPLINKFLVHHYQKELDVYAKPFYAFWKSLNLPMPTDYDLARDYHSQIDLALFSQYFARKQEDWPPGATVIGFIFNQELEPSTSNLEPKIKSFISKSHQKPLIFTLGSGANYAAGDFYEMAVDATLRLSQRAIFILGKMTDNLAAKLNSLPQEKRDQFLILEYAPYAEVFSLASIIVNQGGIGTIAECIRAKKPMLIIPFAGDQFDNADRAARMGVARWIKVENLSVAKLTTDLGRLLYNTQYTLQAEVIAKKIAQEEGLQKALKIINSQL